MYKHSSMVSSLIVMLELLTMYSRNGGIHNIIKQWTFVRVGYENETMGCPNLVQGDLD